MIRRSFRIGLTLGLLGGLAFAVVKMLGGRPGAEAPDRPQLGGPTMPPQPPRSEPWPPLEPSRPQVPPAPTDTADPEPAAEKAPARKAPAKKAAAKKAPAKKKPTRIWVEPTGDTCPTSHPVKAKLSSKIFHLPGMLNYERTNPDRCYRDPDAAESDGLRPAKR